MDDTVDFALEVVAIGFLVVLVTLVLLYGILLAFHYIFSKNEKSGVPNKVFATNPTPVKYGSEDSKLSAVITAAIYYYFENHEPTYKAGKIKVVAQPGDSSTSSNWQMVGRRQLMEGKAELETIRRNSKGEKI